MTRVLTLDGHRLVFDSYGEDGPWVLLLHGIPGSRHTWRAVARALAPSYRVLVPDLVGFGESDAPATPLHAAAQASVLAALLDALQVDDVHVVGFDFGGPTAVLLQARAGWRVRTLTLINANVLTTTPIPRPLRVARRRWLGRVALRLLLGRRGQELLWRAATRRREAFPLAEFRLALTPAGVRSTRRLFRTSLRFLEKLYGPVEALLPSITVPTLVLWSTEDPFFSEGIGRQMAYRIPLARFATVARCGHFLPQEAPGECADVLCRLFASVARAPAN